MRMELGRFERSGLLGIAMAVGEECQEGCRVVPVLTLPGLRHPHEFAQCQGSGVDADFAGELPEEAITVCATESGSIWPIVSSAWSSSRSATCWVF